MASVIDTSDDVEMGGVRHEPQPLPTEHKRYAQPGCPPARHTPAIINPLDLFPVFVPSDQTELRQMYDILDPALQRAHARYLQQSKPAPFFRAKRRSHRASGDKTRKAEMSVSKRQHA